MALEFSTDAEGGALSSHLGTVMPDGAPMGPRLSSTGQPLDVRSALNGLGAVVDSGRGHWQRSREGARRTGDNTANVSAQAEDLMGIVKGQQIRSTIRQPGTQPEALPLIANGQVRERTSPPLVASTRPNFRVSGYQAGVTASSIGSIRAISMRPTRPPTQRHTQTARVHTVHTSHRKMSPDCGPPSQSEMGIRTQHASAETRAPTVRVVSIDAPQGIKAALDSCRLPMVSLSSLKGEDDGFRIVNARGTRVGINSQRSGAGVDQDGKRPGHNLRSSDRSNELLVCNSQRVEDTDLVFMSQFESGNLLTAQRVGAHEYDLQLQVDHATTGHTQWFFFCVSNTFPGVQYRFNIINFAKPDSLYARGQQPLFFSLSASLKDKVGWQRIGRDVRYFRNGRKGNGKSLFTLSFLVEFAHAKDKCLFAHCYPYTYTELQDYLAKVLLHPGPKQFVTSEVLCATLGGNECPVLTITAPDGSEEEKRKRKAIFISSRVHPGESNSSWIMKGLLDFLLSSSKEADHLRCTYVFKIVPMLNPDGVINGHYRCNLAGYDLNRHWHDPSPTIHPTIFHAKELLKRLQEERGVAMFCDIHGHSVKHNLFVYGCPKVKDDMTQPPAETQVDDNVSLEFPNAMNLVSSAFSMPDSRFVVEKIKEHTGRVVAWRELGIAQSYTLEASLCGSGEGKSTCTAQFACADFEAMGREFGVALAVWSSAELHDQVKNNPDKLQELLAPLTWMDDGTEDRTKGCADNDKQNHVAHEGIEGAPKTGMPRRDENVESHFAPGKSRTGAFMTKEALLLKTTKPSEKALQDAPSPTRKNLASGNVDDRTFEDTSDQDHTKGDSFAAGGVSQSHNIFRLRRDTDTSRHMYMQSEVAASSVGLGNDEEVSSSDDEHDENSHFEHDTGRNVCSEKMANFPKFMADCNDVQTLPVSLALQHAHTVPRSTAAQANPQANSIQSTNTSSSPVQHTRAQARAHSHPHPAYAYGQHRSREAIEAELRGLCVISSARKPERPELTSFINLSNGSQSARAAVEHPALDSSRGRAQNRAHPDHAPSTSRHWQKQGSQFAFIKTDPFPTPNTAQAEFATPAEAFSPQARRHRGTATSISKRVQDKHLVSYGAYNYHHQKMHQAQSGHNQASQVNQHSSGNNNGYGNVYRNGGNAVSGWLGAHKPVGPQCKFLPIMLGSLRSVEYSPEPAG